MLFADLFVPFLGILEFGWGNGERVVVLEKCNCSVFGRSNSFLGLA